MPHQLMEIEASRTMNKTMFAHRLHIFDNKMVYHARSYFVKITEVTISYNHVSQVYLTKGLFFATLEIINTGGTKDIIIKYVPKKKAEQAKRIIDSKIHNLTEDPFSKEKTQSNSNLTKKRSHAELELNSVEMALSRLEELLLRNRISKKEYEKKRKSILQDMK